MILPPFVLSAVGLVRWWWGRGMRYLRQLAAELLASRHSRLGPNIGCSTAPWPSSKRVMELTLDGVCAYPAVGWAACCHGVHCGWRYFAACEAAWWCVMRELCREMSLLRYPSPYLSVPHKYLQSTVEVPQAYIPLVYCYCSSEVLLPLPYRYRRLLF